VSRTSAHVLLGLSAPLLLDALGKESELRRFDGPGLSRFLSDQEEHARDLLPGVVERAARASSPPPSGTDRVGKPLWGAAATAGVLGSTSAAARLRAVMHRGQLETREHVHEQAADLRAGEEIAAPTEQLPEKHCLPRSLLWLVAAVALFGLLTWGLMRLAPRPQPVPAAPNPMGATTPNSAPAIEPSPGNTTGVDQSPATTAMPATGSTATSESTGSTATPGSSAAGSTAARTGDTRPASLDNERAGAANAGSSAANNAAPPASPAATAASHAAIAEDIQARATREGPERAAQSAAGTAGGARLTGQEAVIALENAAPERPRGDRLQTVAPPAVVPANLGSLERTPVASLDESGHTDGIAETQRSNVARASGASLLPAYFAGGALPPKRFIVGHLSFAPGSAVMPRDSRVLDRTAEALSDHPGATVLIEGYADRPEAEMTPKDAKLATARAESVREYLADRGVARSRLKAASAAVDQPMRSGRDQRVELVVLTR